MGLFTMGDIFSSEDEYHGSGVAVNTILLMRRRKSRSRRPTLKPSGKSLTSSRSGSLGDSLTTPQRNRVVSTSSDVPKTRPRLLSTHRDRRQMMNKLITPRGSRASVLIV